MVSLNSRTAVEVASLTKIMTCLVILDLVKEKPLLLEDTLKIGLF